VLGFSIFSTCHGWWRGIVVLSQSLKLWVLISNPNPPRPSSTEWSKNYQDTLHMYKHRHLETAKQPKFIDVQGLCYFITVSLSCHRVMGREIESR
jgi:hypothetical protein